jgi:hypothetical protein
MYYTGHGAQNPGNKSSYLLGVDADVLVASDVAEFGVNLSDISENMSGLGSKAIFPGV